jgi:hypothetical protein
MLTLRVLRRQAEAYQQEVEAWKVAHRDAADADWIDDVVRTDVRAILGSFDLTLDRLTRKRAADQVQDAVETGALLRGLCSALLSFLEELRSWADELAASGYELNGRADLDAACERLNDRYDGVALSWPGEEEGGDPELKAVQDAMRQRLPSARLLELAAERRPPQSWYDEPDRPVPPRPQGDGA